MQRNIFIILFFLLLVNCTKEKQESLSNQMTWEKLKSKSKKEETRVKIDSLKNILSIEEGRFLLGKLDLLKNPARLRKLKEIESKQFSAGGSFYGVLPTFYQDNGYIPTPDSFDKKIETALFLAKQQKSVQTILDDPAFPYNRNFLGQKIKQKPIRPYTSDLSLDIDISAIESVLNYYNEKKRSKGDLTQIINHFVFKNMLKHRRDLGYLPEPLPTKKDLADFIRNSCRIDPIYQIWNWINPCNFFCFSDLYQNKEKFHDLITYIRKNRDQIEYQVLSRIDPFIPADFKFSDRISFGVNFGIRSWATKEAIGTNIVQVKDDFDALLRTMRHEVFHHVQLSLIQLSPDIREKKPIDFSDLTYWDLNSEYDQAFYKILAYIYLEGTATYIGAPDRNNENQLSEGIALLNQIHQKIYETKDLSKIDQLLNQGLKSNGPFYALGHYMTKMIDNQLETEKVQHVFQKGPIYFFKTYLEVSSDGLSATVDHQINNIYREIFE